MNRSLGPVAVITFGLAIGFAACGAPETFHLFTGQGGSTLGTGGSLGAGGVVGPGTGGAIGTGGAGVFGTGGLSGTGGGIATGGRIGSGGAVGTGGRLGSGGSSATGGRAATGGASATGGAVGTGGSANTGGRAGSGGAGGGNCLTVVQNAGYVSGTEMCSACRDNATPLADKCMEMIDCLQPLWPCTGNCMTNCLNMVGGSGVVASCVQALTTVACGT